MFSLVSGISSIALLYNLPLVKPELKLGSWPITRAYDHYCKREWKINLCSGALYATRPSAEYRW